MDISNETMEWYWPDGVELPGFRAPRPPDPGLAREAARLILAAERPVIYAGGGILQARAAEALRRLAELTGIHVVTTLMARGAFPDDHPQALGMPGMHGNYTAVTAMQRSDLLIALGSRFDDRVTGKVPAFAPGAKIIHVDIDPAELGKVRRADVGIAADCRSAIGAKVGKPDRMVWAIDGDGCFQMTAQELVTASAERVPIKVAILNNAYLGMVRQWQELFYKERYSEVYLSPDLPDYVKWAEAMGCVGLRVENPEDVAPTIEKANAIGDRPGVIDLRVDYREKVYPMVAAGRWQE